MTKKKEEPQYIMILEQAFEDNYASIGSVAEIMDVIKAEVDGEGQDILDRMRIYRLGEELEIDHQVVLVEKKK